MKAIIAIIWDEVKGEKSENMKLETICEKKQVMYMCISNHIDFTHPSKIV